MHFKNKVVWITGASSGIGAALATQLAAQEARLLLTARNKEALHQVAAACAPHGALCTILPADMLQTDSLPTLASAAIAVHGRIDLVIFSAGSSQRSVASATDIAVYRQLMELNFFAPVMLTQSLLPQFRQQGSGHIVAISSVAGLMGFPMRTGYAASKHALKGFFETLQTEQEDQHLAITLISPGRIHTPISMHALQGDGTPYGKMDDGQLKGIPVAVCAQKIIAAIRAKKKHLIIARQEKLLYWIWWFARPLYYRIARRKGMPAKP